MAHEGAEVVDVNGPYCPTCGLLDVGGTCGCTRDRGNGGDVRHQGEWIRRVPWTSEQLEDLRRRVLAKETHASIVAATSRSRASVRTMIRQLRKKGVLPPARQSAR